MDKSIFLREKGAYQAAEQTYRQAIDLLRKNFSNKNSSLSNAYYQYSIQALKLGQYQKALDLADTALLYNKTTVKIGEQVETKILSGISQINYLLHKADVVKKTGTEEALKDALEVLNSGLDFVTLKKAGTVGTKFGLEATTNLRNKALDICYELFSKTGDQQYATMALQYGEMAKSQQLKEWVYQAQEGTELNDENLRVKQEIENQLIFYQNLLTTATAEDSAGLANQQRFADSLFAFKKKYFDIVETLKTSNPRYYQTMYEQLTSLEDRMELATDQGEGQVVAYQKSDSSLYALVIGKQNHMIQLANNVDIDDLIIQYRKQLYDPTDESFTQTGETLYKHLIQPLTPYLTTQKLKIITDGMLAYLPFELLINDNGQYLFEEQLISYDYSLTSTPSHQKTNTQMQMIAFAPDFKNEGLIAQQDVVRGALSKLTGAFDEVNTLEKLYPGAYFTKEIATEENFRMNADRYGLIHLATHAIVDDSDPDRSKLVFNLENDSLNDGYLHAYEIYNLSLNAEMVTLSACNTGFGKIKKGEGVMSLARAFAYAGVPATVVSLWPASDKSTPKLMKSFYENLKNGQNKDEALANAKKTYLNTATGKAKHPFYWGGFVVVGDESGIVSGNSTLWWWIAGGSLFLISLLVFRKKLVASK
ncbi:MAG: CHAT domain-containing tetratricopeptide repeat protein [Bacteroidota bacterium]